jgi:uncharacterized membrane protein
MCIVIDSNTLAPVFNHKCCDHNDFRPIRDWIDRGDGFLVFGGTRYKQELKAAFRYLKLVRQMKDAGRAVAINDDLVDAEENRIRSKLAGTICNDQHIIALLAVSWCTLFCSVDSHSYTYIKDRSLYPPKMHRVRIYRSARNSSLLKRTDRNKVHNAV